MLRKDSHMYFLNFSKIIFEISLTFKIENDLMKDGKMTVKFQTDQLPLLVIDWYYHYHYQLLAFSTPLFY